MRRLVLKFGGSSLGSVRAISSAAEIVRNQAADSSIIVVVSALAGVTDTLLEASLFACEGRVEHARQRLLKAVSRYSELAVEVLENRRLRVFLDALANACAELMALVGRPYHPLCLQDDVVSYGERLSSRLFALVLQERGIASVSVEAESIIITTREHGAASPLLEECYVRACHSLRPYLQSRVIPVIGGFIGATPEGRTTTLGRGGSDYTATILGAALRVAEVQIWTDVSGIHTADPSIVRNAQVIPEIGYEDASLLALYGAKVIHPRTVLPVKELAIPVRICNTLAPSAPNTLITQSRYRPAALALQQCVARLPANLHLSQLKGVSALVRKDRECWAVFESIEAMQGFPQEYEKDFAAIFLLGLAETPQDDIVAMEYVRGGALLIVEKARAQECLRRLHRMFFAKPQHAPQCSSVSERTIHAI